MDEKNAYIELVKQNRAKHRAKLKASKEIKKLEQKKEKVILKYEQAAKDNTCITFHQYCRKKWASEAGIESVPDDDETDVEWQEKLNAKVNFKQKQKKLREQRVRQTGWSESTWDCSFSDSNEVLQSDEAESPKGVSQAVFDERPKAREKIKKKLEAARHKPDPSVPAEKLSDYLSSLNARDAVPPPILVRDDIPDNVQEGTLSKPASRPIFEPAIKKTSKTLSIVERAGELKKDVHIISYGNTLYYHNKYYYTQLDAKQLIKKSMARSMTEASFLCRME